MRGVQGRLWADVELLVARDLPGELALGDVLGRGVLPPGRDGDPLSTWLPRIRPVLVALAARASGASAVDPEAQYAAEVLHLALVVHDVALGQRGGRRRRVAKRVLRRSVSVLAGSHITLRALELARHASSPAVLGEVVDTLREIADGQEVADQLRRGALPSREDWREHADGHIAAVFSFCCRAGAHLGAADLGTITSLGRYGRHVGRLWHAAEDVLALEGDEGPSHLVNRALSGRPVLPVIAATEVLPAFGDRWRRFVRAPDEVAAGDLLGEVIELGALGASREVMARESWSARRALAGVAPSDYRAALDQLAADLGRARAA